MYDVHLRLIGKRTVDFLIDATAEALRVNIDWKSVISLLWRPVDPKFQVEVVAPSQPFFFSEN